MREGVMSGALLFARTAGREEARPQDRTVSQGRGWNPEIFAQEQIKGLVRQVFFSSAERPVRQIVISAVEPEADVRNLCRRVGEALALETTGRVAVVGECLQVLQDAELYQSTQRPVRDEPMPLRQAATRVRENLWLLPPAKKNQDCITTASLHLYLGEVRREFDYSIVEAPAAGESNLATAMAQFADGIILVLSAHRTRRIMARKIKEMLERAQARILGTVLSDRDFPIPEGIYQRL